MRRDRELILYRDVNIKEKEGNRFKKYIKEIIMINIIYIEWYVESTGSHMNRKRILNRILVIEELA